MRRASCSTARWSNGPVELRAWLNGYSQQFVRVAVEKMLTYALGRGLEYQDMPLVRAIARDAARDNNRFSALVMAIVKSPPFQMNTKVTPGTGGAQRPPPGSNHRFAGPAQPARES